MESVNIKELNDRIQQESGFVDILSLEMGKVIVGQKHLVENLVIALLANGHILLEGMPGLAKTLAISTLSKAINAKFSRIQFTPDLLPADVSGTLIYSQKKEEFEVRKGPVFANFVLADEINRAPAKVQSALLEAMQERQVTIGDQTFALPEPFLVMATQNPVEQEGTYPLPEAQVDRFMLKVKVDYPKKEEEKLIIRMNNTGEFPKPNAVVSPEDIIRARNIVREVYMDEKIERYIVDIVYATRTPEEYGLKGLKDLISCSPPAPYPIWTLSERDLARHPHISKDEAHSIVLYRTHQPPDSWTLAGMHKAGILSEEHYAKLARCVLAGPEEAEEK